MNTKAELQIKVVGLKEVQQLSKLLDKISKKINAINKKPLSAVAKGVGKVGGQGGGSGSGSAKSELTEEQKRIQLVNKRLTIQNRGLGVESKNLDLKLKGTTLDKAAIRLSRVKNLTQEDNLDLAKNKILLADREIKQTQLELKEQRGITTEVKKRTKFLKGAPTGFTAAQFGPQMTPTKGAGQAAMSIDTITKQSEKRLRIELKLRELEAKGVNIAKIRVKMGELVDAQNRGDFGSIKKINTAIGRSISKEESKLKILQLQNKERLQANKLTVQESTAQGAFSRISDRQSRDAQGERTFMNNPLARGMGKLGATKGFDVESAMISGAFPLLFGQGPIGAIAGGLGGGIGGMFGGMGGFAGGIAATAIVQTISSALDSISKLGQALGPFTQNAEAVTTALGLQGSVQEAQIKLIEQVEGKTAAFNAASKIMAAEIGTRGVDALKKFGENSRIFAGELSLALTKLQALTAGLLNFIGSITGINNALKVADAGRIVKSEAALGDTEAQGLQARQEAINKQTKDSSSLINSPSIQESLQLGVDQKRLNIEKQLFAIRKKTSVELANETTKSSELLAAKEKEVDLNNRVKEIMKKGINKELATSLATVEQTFDIEGKVLQSKLNQAKAEFNKLEKENASDEVLNRVLEKEIAIEGKIDEHNLGKKETVKLTKQISNETDKVAEAFQRLNETIRNDIKEGIKGLIKGTSTLGDLLNNVADRFLDLALNQALFGNAAGEFSKGGGGGIFGAIAGIFKANGGPVRSGKSFIVGEKGPELFTPGRSGAITPNNKLGGGGSTSVVVNVDASGSDVQGDDAGAKELGTLISVAVQGELIKQQRPGGLLASVR